MGPFLARPVARYGLLAGSSGQSAPQAARLETTSDQTSPRAGGRATSRKGAAVRLQQMKVDTELQHPPPSAVTVRIGVECAAEGHGVVRVKLLVCISAAKLRAVDARLAARRQAKEFAEVRGGRRDAVRAASTEPRGRAPCKVQRRASAAKTGGGAGAARSAVKTIVRKSRGWGHGKGARSRPARHLKRTCDAAADIQEKQLAASAYRLEQIHLLRKAIETGQTGELVVSDERPTTPKQVGRVHQQAMVLCKYFRLLEEAAQQNGGQLPTGRAYPLAEKAGSCAAS